MNWYILSQNELSDEDFEEVTKSEWQPINSSFIEAVAYYDIPKIFEIKMKNGKEYTFRHVPKEVFDNFMKAESKGRFFGQNIKGKYSFKEKH